MTRTERGGRRFKDIKQQAVFDAELASLELTEQVVAAMQKKGLKRKDLADRMGMTKGAVTQLLDGPNFTFRTAALLALAAGVRFYVGCREEEERRRVTRGPKIPAQKEAADEAVISYAKHALTEEMTIASEFLDMEFEANGPVGAER